MAIVKEVGFPRHNLSENNRVTGRTCANVVFLFSSSDLSHTRLSTEKRKRNTVLIGGIRDAEMDHTGCAGASSADVAGVGITTTTGGGSTVSPSLSSALDELLLVASPPGTGADGSGCAVVAGGDAATT